ncbi:MAG: cardiolipin synthase [Porphyromonadaceae bacterium CG2_30_38_12]|nr:MAG: cardiolipin synthase [Porphyromonadaceae bacterium CG2_30_38_12]
MQSILTITIIVLYVYTLVSTISVLLLENRNPAKSLAWVLVLLFLPLIGLGLYLVFGQNLRKQKIIEQKSFHAQFPPSILIESSNLREGISSNFQNLVELLYKNSEAKLYMNNKIDILHDGKSTFNAMFEAIRNAKNHIHIEFFIFGNDKISNRLRVLLIRKAKQGVRVRMIYDYWGSFFLSRLYLRTLREAGVYIRPFLPFRLRFGRSKINYRNHRKLLIVDGNVGFTGGLNVADRYIFGNSLGMWRDTFVRFEGAVVHGLQQLFLNDWYFVERKIITDRKYFPEPEKHNDNFVQIVSSGPDTDWENIMQGVAAAIMAAKQYVFIHTPYFIPNDLINSCVQLASMSGVDIRLMIPTRSDSRLSDLCTSSYLGQVLEAGIRVYRYKKGFLHSKAIVIDDYISVVGSANLDERSFNQNFEANAFIYDTQTALELKKLFNRDIINSEEITLETWNNRKRFLKLKESFARLFSPLV